MNTKEYIESGILEAHVLGSLPPQEQAQVRADISRYPELAAEVRAIELALQQFAAMNAVEPPAFLQDKIWNSIQLPTANGGGTPADARPPAKVISLQPEYRKPAMDWRYAAMIGMIVSSLALNYILWSQGRELREERAALAVKMDKMDAEQKQLAAFLADYQKSTAMMADTAMQTIVMHTVVKGHPMAATLYWSKDKGAAYVAMDALPQPPEGMQYQLWVIQNGKPISMGTLPNNMANTPAMNKIAMQVTAGEAFAISLEKEGGNPTPTTVYVMGKV